MATLQDITQHQSFTIQPILPTPTGPQNAYDVRLVDNEQGVFERQYTTYPWSPDGHWNVWRLIRAFQSAPQTLEGNTDFNLSASGADEFRESASLQVKTGWLTVVLQGKTKKGQHPQPWKKVTFVVGIYLLNGPQPEMAEQTLVPMVHMEMLCLPDAVETFGHELLSECREALHRRHDLGIAAPADDYLDT